MCPSHGVVFREGFFRTPFEFADCFESVRRYQGELAFCKWKNAGRSEVKVVVGLYYHKGLSG